MLNVKPVPPVAETVMLPSAAHATDGFVTDPPRLIFTNRQGSGGGGGGIPPVLLQETGKNKTENNKIKSTVSFISFFQTRGICESQKIPVSC
jgi:hypothetical protein